MAKALPFHATDYEIPCGTNRVSLASIEGAAAAALADKIVKIDPWHTLETDSTKLAAALVQEDQSAFRRAIVSSAGCVGVISVRNPWLFGPYLALLAVFPEHQRMGVGSAILEWLEREVSGTASNIWACVSSFNAEAQSFYARHGFREAGDLPDLVRNGFSEILIRKRLRTPARR